MSRRSLANSWLRHLASLLLAVMLPGCGGSPRSKPPTPLAATRPVTPGVVVQLRLAVEGFDTVFDMRAEEQDLLPMLVHAWATFYGLEDPAATAKARYELTERLCRRRLPNIREPRDLFACMDGLREALLADLIWVIDSYLGAGHPDRVGGYSLKKIRKVISLRRQLLLASLPTRRQRRSRRPLPLVARCRLRQPLAPVLNLGPREISINSFPVLTWPRGAPGRPADQDMARLRYQLESRLMESQAAGKQPEQLILATRGTPSSPLWLRVVSLAASLGVSRVCLKATRKGPFRVPCCLPVRLSPKVVHPRPALELDARGLRLVSDKGSHPVALSQKDLLAALAQLGPSGAQPPLVLLAGARPRQLLRAVEALVGMAEPELIPPSVTLPTRRPPPGRAHRGVAPMTRTPHPETPHPGTDRTARAAPMSRPAPPGFRPDTVSR